MSFQSLNLQKIVSLLLYFRNVVILDVVDSTNQYIIDNISHLKSGFVCLAECQTHGRGRYGKYWFSPFSNNIYLSIYWSFSKGKGISISILCLVVSIVIGNLLKDIGVQGITFKWPNDIYYKDRKLAGVLVEVINEFSGFFDVVIGIGINITIMFECFIDGIRIISLEEMGVFVDRNILVANLINSLHQLLLQFEFFGSSLFFSLVSIESF